MHHFISFSSTRVNIFSLLQISKLKLTKVKWWSKLIWLVSNDLESQGAFHQSNQPLPAGPYLRGSVLFCQIPTRYCKGKPCSDIAPETLTYETWVFLLAKLLFLTTITICVHWQSIKLKVRLLMKSKVSQWQTLILLLFHRIYDVEITLI